MFFLFIPGVRLRDGNCHINVTFSSLSPLYHHDNNHHNDDDASNKTTTTTTTRPNATTTISGANGTRDATASRVPGIFLLLSFLFCFFALLTHLSTVCTVCEPRREKKRAQMTPDAAFGPWVCFLNFFFSVLLTTKAHSTQRRPTKANTGPQQPTEGQHRPTKAHSTQRRPTKAHSTNDGQQRPTAAHEGPQHPTTANKGPQHPT